MRSAWRVPLGPLVSWVPLLLLGGCLGPGADPGGPDGSGGPSPPLDEAPGSSTTYTVWSESTTTHVANCHGDQKATWTVPGLAAAYGNLSADRRRSAFSHQDGFQAGGGPGHPDWPLDGVPRSIAWQPGETILRAEHWGHAVAVSLYAPLDTRPGDREAQALAFLERVQAQPEGERADLARRLARDGGRLPDAGVEGPSRSWYYGRVLHDGLDASVAGLVPGILENRTDGAGQRAWRGSVEFSRAMEDGLWTLEVRLPLLHLALPRQGALTVDSLGHGASVHAHWTLGDQEQVRQEILAAIRGAGHPVEALGLWTLWPDCR